MKRVNKERGCKEEDREFLRVAVYVYNAFPLLVSPTIAAVDILRPREEG